MITVTYINHSGFMVELDEIAFLFDYYNGEVPKTEKPLYIFSSHRHHDHFNSEILEMPYKKLILSSDIRCAVQGNMVKIAPNKTVEVDDFKIKTIKSTDEGVAFIVFYGDMVIYHAGDLNDWFWLDESDDWNSRMEKNYRHRLLKAFEDIEMVDIAFIPVDSRQKQWCDKGAKFFLENIAAKNVFPMHFWEDYNCIESFCNKYSQYNIHKLEKKNQIVYL